MLGRNPFTLAATLMAVLTVRAVWSGHAVRVSSWRGIVRLAVVFSVISVLFNVLTVRSGDRVLARFPDAVPLLDGPITWNALVFGILSAMAVVTLVLIGTTVGALVDWTVLTRLTPERLTTFAVAGSVAVAFIPQTTIAFREIREAQAIRGHRFRGIRDLVPIVVPLLTGGLERAVTMAEALESRGFGGSSGAVAVRRRHGSPLIALGLASVTLAGYLFAVGSLVTAGIAASVGVIALPVGWKSTARLGPRRTQYRRTSWTFADWLTLGGAAVACTATLVSLAVDPRSLRYEPYPDLIAPHVNPLLILAQLALLIPAFVAIPIEEER
jgi:energy-coupling factor transport system permease protein